MASSSHPTRNQFPSKLYPSSFFIGGETSYKVINNKFDCFLWCNTLHGYIRMTSYSYTKSIVIELCTYDELGAESSIETKNPFVAKDFLHAIQTVFIEHLPDNVSALVLHPS